MLQCVAGSNQTMNSFDIHLVMIQSYISISIFVYTILNIEHAYTYIYIKSKMKHLQIYAITILVFYLIHTSHANNNEIQQLQILVELGGQVQISSNRTLCEYIFIMASKYAYLQLECNQNVNIWRFNVSERLEYEQYDMHMYSLKNLDDGPELANKQNTNSIRVLVQLGMQWQYNLTIQMDEQSEIFIEGKYTTNRVSIAYLFVIYTVLSLVVLPPQLTYFENMQGLSIYSIFISILLSLTVLINLCVIVWKYMRVLTGGFNSEGAFGLLLLMMSLAATVVHIFYKNRSFVRSAFRVYSSNRARFLCIALVWGLSIVGLAYYVRIHKDVSTYIFFASGAIYYMTTFFMCSHMKRYYFSFRVVLFDGLCILVLAACSKIYPILFYQIPNYYQLVGVYLLVAVLWVYGGIIFILINIIKQDKDNRIKEMEMLEGTASTHDDANEELGQKNLHQTQNGKRYKKMRQECISNQDSNSSQNSGIGENISALSSDIKEHGLQMKQ